MSDSLTNDLAAIVGAAQVQTGAADLEPFVTEWRGLWRGHAHAVVLPASAEEVASVVAYCAAQGISVVPQGGNTGLVGGGVPEGGIVLSLKRLNRIRGVDPLNHTITVDAGCILADVQAAAAAEDRLFPLSLAAEGSCTIGGNLATNAGGVQVLRYGNARDLVLGIEAVLPDGRLLSGLRGLRKDNTGYDLKHLLMGSEGTLGIITAAVLKLFPRPTVVSTALVAAESLDNVMELFVRAKARAPGRLTAFEFINDNAFQMAITYFEANTDPFDAPHKAYALMDVAGASSVMEDILGPALEDGTLEDAVLASNERQAKALWHIRETIPEAQGFAGGSIKHDISVPISTIPGFVSEMGAALAAFVPGSRLVAFGHMGDGNLHFNLSQPEDMDKDAFLERWDDVKALVHGRVNAANGSFSAEHGVGLLKRKDMADFKDPVELRLMRALKAEIDPNGIMNPGKVLPEG